MGRIALALFIAITLLKIEWLGINGAGALTIAQLLLIGWLDNWLSKRTYERDSQNS